jgi:hypothetical protein
LRNSTNDKIDLCDPHLSIEQLRAALNAASVEDVLTPDSLRLVLIGWEVAGNEPWTQDAMGADLPRLAALVFATMLEAARHPPVQRTRA